MLRVDYLILDFETTSKNAHRAQPTQIACALVERKNLTILDRFSSYIKPEFDDNKCIELGLDPVTDEVLEKTKIKRETLVKAPPLKVVWKQFCDFVNKYNYKKTVWDAPIPVGHNLAYDMILVDRICGHEPYKLGPYDDEFKKQKILHTAFSIDTMTLWMYWSENLAKINSLSLDSIREYMGMPNEQAHNAEFDVEQTAQLFARFLRLARGIAPVTKFKGSFSEAK